MTTEMELINKTYYQTLVDDYKKKHPINVLGEMHLEEMKKERPDLSAIRYAQGEVYFLNKDYEAAIYKWGHPIEDNLFPWAQKNIADSYFEMGLFAEAEEFYKEVETQSVSLNAEVLLQLFSLYIQQNRLENATDAIKEAVKLDPDYSDVTEVAQSFFENYEDWDNAIDLAVNEAIRTKSLSWFEVLEGYAEQGLTISYDPIYFKETLVTLLHMDKLRFESLTEQLWKKYKQNDYFIKWLEEFNQLLLTNHVEESYTWKKLPDLFKESYFELISGRFLIRDIAPLIPNHLTNWLEVSSVSDTLISSTAILAWDTIFQSDLNENLVREAQYHFEQSNATSYGRQEGKKLFESIKRWAEQEGLIDDLTEFMEPVLEEYNIDVASPSKIQSVIKTSIEFLVEKRAEVENGIMDRINWNEEVIAGIEDIDHQLKEMEKAETDVVKDSFSQIKNDFFEGIMSKLSEELQSCSEMVHEDSDFGKLHIEINDEMNRRIAGYMEYTAQHDFKNAVNEWLESCNKGLHDSQIKMNEMTESFNQQYGEEKIVLDGDSKILDDWLRDLERISRGMMHMENVNIMMRNNPAQLLLKGTGKLLGSVPTNKERLHYRYKDYIENEDYRPIIQELINPFQQQLELFERSLEWDVSKFFSTPFEELNQVSEELQGTIEKHQDSLNTMREKPEIYRDPLTLFELQLHQYELMNALS
ncbi:lipopolysaccharide assembly protein LapB [Lentibacillus sp. CBA3610]|uniref:tetratricopeptide repeat protein n=1 Tax=Lentibacillus sp. CBA3610 TaxID=2518176 RepID=UPI001594F9C2|nr:tetratricopeptide repeat protein [Lentibacillus sp. CBA3610]QKY68687.1 tetratricopeptide repeat protein [Lentibacillus sp. CBA3610]